MKRKKTAAGLGLLGIKVVALGVTNEARAHRFYSGKLGLKPAYEGRKKAGVFLGDVILMLKKNWKPPTADPNYRITLAVKDAHTTERALRKRRVVISDPVAQYDEAWVGGFFDSEGNKLYFCSTAK